MNEGIAVEVVASKHALDRPRTAGTARLWVGEGEEGQIQIAFDVPGADLLLTEDADKAAERFYSGYIIESLMNGDDSVESQIRATRRLWAELLACAESWEDQKLEGQGLPGLPARLPKYLV
jgi:hypothetical protein